MLRNLAQWVAHSLQISNTPLIPGTDVRGYIIERVLHRGGMSWVYKARDSRGIAVVIKEFFPSNSAYRDAAGLVQPSTGKEDFYREAYRRFHEEGRCLGMFRGPTFSRARTFFKSFNTAYIVMEIERGRTLSSFIKVKHSPLDWDHAKPYMRDIRNGLLAMHKQNILHMDLHPGNIFLTLSGRGLILDFGAARHIAEPMINNARFLTPGFSAPEVKNGGVCGAWSDIYSFGACLRATGAFRQKDWPPSVAKLASECLLVHPSQRPQSFDASVFDILR